MPWVGFGRIYALFGNGHFAETHSKERYTGHVTLKGRKWLLTMDRVLALCLVPFPQAVLLNPVMLHQRCKTLSNLLALKPLRVASNVKAQHATFCRCINMQAANGNTEDLC